MSKVIFGEATPKIFRVDFRDGDSGGRTRHFGVATSEESAIQLAAEANGIPAKWAENAVSLGPATFIEATEEKEDE